MGDAPKAERLRSLDAFRGATIAAMILVNNPGSWAHIYPPLRHAEWFGWTPTDLIFPFFLFIVGAAMAFSMRRYVEREAPKKAAAGRIARRVVVLFLLGLVLNGFWEYHLATIRIPGVLQRIALVYLIASVVVLTVGGRAQLVLAGVMLGAYTAMLMLVPFPGDDAGRMTPSSNIVRSVDLTLLGRWHLYRGSPTDPEGLLSTIPAVVTALSGYWVGLLVRDRKRDGALCARLIVAGLVCAATGQVLGYVHPISKPLWTSTYVLLTSGLAAACFGACLWAIDVRGWRRWSRPFEVMGVNAIFVFVASGLVARVLVKVDVGGTTLKGWIYTHGFGSWLDGANASLGFAIATLGFWWLVLGVMERLGLRIRV